MEKRSYLKEFTNYTFLSVLGTLGVSCYILADTFFISKGLGANGLTALNLAIPVYNFIYGTGLMLGMGAATRFSVCKSQGRQDEINRLYSNTIFISLIFSVIYMLLGVFFSKDIASLLGADTSVLELTNTYLYWLMLFAPAFILNNVFLCFVRNDGSPHLAMAAMLIGSFSNIILDYVFIFPMNMGIFGAIFATGLSPIISILIMLPHWIKKKNTFHFIWTSLRFYIFKQDVALGFPSLVSQVSGGIVMIVFNMIILGLAGNTGVAAYGVVANISLVIIAIYTGIGQGIQPLISTFYGKGEKYMARKMLNYAMITMLILSFVIYTCIYLFADPITSVFNSENNMALQEIAVTGLKIYFIASPFIGYNIILSTFFTSVERAIPAYVLSLLRGFILIIPFAFLLSALWSMTGVWMTYPVTEFLTTVIGVILYERIKRKEIVHLEN